MGDILDVIVIGAGSAGLGVSYFLSQQGLAHRVLDGGRIAETWRTQRWDSFLLNSPTIRSLLPGDTYEGTDPWGAMTCQDFVSYLENYAERHHLPVSTRTRVTELVADQGMFRVTTSDDVLLARNVVIATGDQNRPVRPPMSADLPSTIAQVDCPAYRSADSLAPGAVLVVGSGQSGAQITEDLVLAGRKVYLATSRTGRWVRHYRGGNMLHWLTLSGFMDVTRAEVIRLAGRVPTRALIGATHTISLQSLSAQGVVLLGRFRGVEDGCLIFGDELHEHLRFGDEVSANTKRLVDEYIERAGPDAPPAEDDPGETVEPRLPHPPIRALDWRASDLGTVIWCTGFTGDFSWIQLPGALDADGQPIHVDGVATVPGLYFYGLDFASTRNSGIVPGIAKEAALLVEALVERSASLTPIT
ncbi:NAD(P)/FAD-dependent oxidoreductase [Rhizobium sp. LjRoot254]